MISTGMPHPMCRMCANWLPDIEEIGCGNNWPKEKNRKTKRFGSKRVLNHSESTQL